MSGCGKSKFEKRKELLETLLEYWRQNKSYAIIDMIVTKPEDPGYCAVLSDTANAYER